MASLASSWHHRHLHGITSIHAALPTSSWHHRHRVLCSRVVATSIVTSVSSQGCGRGGCGTPRRPQRPPHWGAIMTGVAVVAPNGGFGTETARLAPPRTSALWRHHHRWPRGRLPPSPNCGPGSVPATRPHMPPFCVIRNRIKPWRCHRYSELGQCHGDSGVTRGGTGTPCGVRLWRWGGQGNGDMGAGVTSQWPSSSVVGQECGIPKPWHCPLPPPVMSLLSPAARHGAGTCDSPASRSRTRCGPTQGFIWGEDGCR